MPGPAGAIPLISKIVSFVSTILTVLDAIEKGVKYHAELTKKQLEISKAPGLKPNKFQTTTTDATRVKQGVVGNGREILFPGQSGVDKLTDQEASDEILRLLAPSKFTAKDILKKTEGVDFDEMPEPRLVEPPHVINTLQEFDQAVDESAEKLRSFDETINGIEKGFKTFGVDISDFMSDIKGVKEGAQNAKKGLDGLGFGGLTSKLVSGLSFANPLLGVANKIGLAGDVISGASEAFKGAVGAVKKIGGFLGFGGGSKAQIITPEEELKRDLENFNPVVMRDARNFLQDLLRMQAEGITEIDGDEIGDVIRSQRKYVNYLEGLEAQLSGSVGPTGDNRKLTEQRVSTSVVTMTEETGRVMSSTLSSILTELQQGHLKYIRENTDVMARAMGRGTPTAVEQVSADGRGAGM